MFVPPRLQPSNSTRHTAVQFKHSAESVLSVSAPHEKDVQMDTLAKGRFAAHVQAREEHTHPALSSSGRHMRQASVRGLLNGTAWVLCALNSSWRSKRRHRACSTSPSEARRWIMWDERLKRNLTSSQNACPGKKDCFVPLNRLWILDLKQPLRFYTESWVWPNSWHHFLPAHTMGLTSS